MPPSLLTVAGVESKTRDRDQRWNKQAQRSACNAMVLPVTASLQRRPAHCPLHLSEYMKQDSSAGGISSLPG
jgi:hypothetical protein